MENLIGIIEKEIIETNEKRKTIKGLEELILEQKQRVDILEKEVKEKCKELVSEKKILEQFTDEKRDLECKEREKKDKEFKELRQALLTKIEVLGLSYRCYNCLKYLAEVNIVAEVASMTSKDLLSYPNFGKKSLWELETKLKSLHPKLKIGMGNMLEYHIPIEALYD